MLPRTILTTLAFALSVAALPVPYPQTSALGSVGSATNSAFDYIPKTGNGSGSGDSATDKGNPDATGNGDGNSASNSQGNGSGSSDSAGNGSGSGDGNGDSAGNVDGSDGTADFGNITGNSLNILGESDSCDQVNTSQIC